LDKRRRARELAVQGLYQLDIQGDEILPRLNEFFEANEPDVQTKNLAAGWCKKTWNNLAVCDEMITGVATRWNIKRLAMVDRSILRLAVYQLRFCEDIPPKVVINEAIELAKKFSTEKSPRFVNGVLDAVLKKLKQEGIR
jgi:transcription antitermination factor NusB